MSVSQMKKLTVLAHTSDVDRLLRGLLRLRCVDVDTTEEIPDAFRREACETEILSCERTLQEIRTAIDALARFSTRKSSLFRKKPSVNHRSFVAEGLAQQAEYTVKKTCEVLTVQKKLEEELALCRASVQTLLPWRSFDLPLGLQGTAATELFCGVLPPETDLTSLGRALYAAGALAERVASDRSGIYAAFVCHKKDSPAVLSLLSAYGFSRTPFPPETKTAAEELSSLENRIAHLEQEKIVCEKNLQSLAENLTSVEILYDIEKTTLHALMQRSKLICDSQVVLLHGWTPASAEDKLSSYLDSFELAYELAEPEEGDDVPVLLENNGFAKTFEWVLGMYSYPAYGTFDPTFLMGIFYVIIFGLMFADAGYGLLLLLAGFLVPRFVKLGDGLRRSLMMFGYCGISCVLFGVLFGAYFGDLPLAIMRNMMGIAEQDLPNLALLGSSAANIAFLFDPLQNPMGFLLLSLGAGAVHLITGMAVKFYVLTKQGKLVDALLDIASYWLLFAGFGLLVLLPAVGTWVTIGSALLIFLTHGRKEKKFFSKLTKGFLGLYDLISYASDLLSYSRILALGLAAGIIAQVVNILGTMGGATLIGFVGLVVAFALGHMLNLAINVLGTFVHTSRLQYIEFFGKFYEDGGRPFKPALPSDKYTNET